uniref:Uncharacterized protein n=1 Tax=Echeneis naucrates TaxID=173247 RepID=A0A665WV71_ECHNA
MWSAQWQVERKHKSSGTNNCHLHFKQTYIFVYLMYISYLTSTFVFLQRSHKKIKDDEKEKEKKDKQERGHCFWESVTMTMRQISPTKKLEKIEGWEPPQLKNLAETSLGLPLELASWGGQGLEEDSSRYANLSDSKDSTGPVRWTARAKVKLAGIRRTYKLHTASPQAGNQTCHLLIVR